MNQQTFATRQWQAGRKRAKLCIRCGKPRATKVQCDACRLLVRIEYYKATTRRREPKKLEKYLKRLQQAISVEFGRWTVRWDVISWLDGQVKHTTKALARRQEVKL